MDLAPEIAAAVADNELDVAIVTLPVTGRRQLMVTPLLLDPLVAVGAPTQGAGLGVSVSPAMAVRDEVRAGALRMRPLSPPLVRRLGVVRRRDKPETPALRVFLAALAGLNGNRARGRSPAGGAAARAARRAPR